jgi:dihydroorotate dehydrogenase electron transfer subunit
MQYKSLDVLENVMVAENIYKLTLKGEYEVKPGQFFMLKSWEDEPILSRPFSIYDKGEDYISFLYEVKGKGTEKLSRLKKEDKVKALGPLGNGMDISRIKGKVALIGGGIGIAPLAYFAKKIEADVDIYFGFRDEVYGIENLRNKELFITTESGRVGYKGYVTDIFNPFDYNLVITCGPLVMMDKVKRICEKTATPLYLLMESKMACGIGACLVCACKTKDGMRRVCKDGPIFKGEEVVLDA